MQRHQLSGLDEGFQVGYGNISERYKNQLFVISGTQTGHIYPITPFEFTLVTAVDFKNNSLACSGPISASSESLTHAAIYHTLPEINAVIHVHHKKIWKYLLSNGCSTEDIPYGTPEMAFELMRIVQTPAAIQQPLIAMKGHEDGVIAYGTSLSEASNNLLACLRSI